MSADLIGSIAETVSTNDDVAVLAREGAPEGTWLRADRQTGGRGRQGRQWVSPPGNLHASTLVRLRPGDPPAASLALVAAVALQEVLGSLAGTSPVTIKWPNDMLADGAKLAGILLEREEERVVVGFGVNLTAHPPEDVCRATSLSRLAGAAPSPDEALERLAEVFAAWLDLWRREGLGPVRERWLERAHPPGTPLHAGAVEGVFAGLEPDGALRLCLADGTHRVIHAGDVFLV